VTIKKVTVNNNKKALEIETAKGKLSLPFAKLHVAPTSENHVEEIFVDPELARKAVTYRLASGAEDSVPLDAFLDYNRDPDYLRKMTLYSLTLKALELVKRSSLSKREIARKLKTSPAQLYRLLDPANYKKSVDQMMRLAASLGYEVNFTLKKTKEPAMKIGGLRR
jgi:hypothetical protein